MDNVLDPLYMVYVDDHGDYHFKELPYGFVRLVDIYSESHLKKCYQALIDNHIIDTSN